jgi:hypothetical protein
MASQKSKVNMPGVAPGKALTGIPVGDESAKDRVLALLGGSVAEDTYQVSCPLYAKGHINCSRILSIYLKLNLYSNHSRD